MSKVSPKKILKIVQLREMNKSERDTARLAMTSKGSVGRTWNNAKENGWTSTFLSKLSDDE